MTGDDLRSARRRLERLQREHPFWGNRLLAACDRGALSRADFQHVFGQYYCYARDFTRYLCALMTNLEDDLLRARLAENLWEEGGGADPAQRHAEIFRAFLTRGLGVELATIEPTAQTRAFGAAYLRFCRDQPAMATSALLSLATEAIVPRVYASFVRGLLAAGVAEPHLRFFRIHMACDDAHAATLEAIMLHHADQPGWYDACAAAIDFGLTARAAFFDHLVDHLCDRPVAPVDRQSL